MRRKDILIISAILIVITFLAVFGIYWAINGESIFANVKEQVTEIVGNKKTHHSNGWETAIVDKIVHDVPVPAGFTYVEGNTKTGIIIEDSKTQEKYMWIPNQEVDEDIYNAVLEKTYLESSEEEQIENIQKYGGFYVAIGEEITEEISKEEYERLKLLNKSSKTAIETHVITIEEAMLINQMSKNLGTKLITKTKSMTINSNSAIGAYSESIGDAEEILKEKNWDKDIIGEVIKEEINGKTYYVPIPKGFEYEKGMVDTGLKIKNTDNLSFIWIPVGDVIQVRTKFLEAMNGEIEADQISIYENYADSLNSDEYKALEASIDKYGGFYISEAELGYDENGIVINKYRPMYSTKGTDELDYVTNGDYFRNVTNLADKNTTLGKMQRIFNEDERTLYEKAIDQCSDLYNDSETVVSHLTYGLEYDATILYLLNNKALTEEQAFKNSTEIGKYAEDEDGNKSLWGEENYLNEIYGLAGNLAEITQEKDGDNVIIRGGSWDIPGNIEYIASKSSRGKTEIDLNNEGEIRSAVGFRACLYIKTEYEYEDGNKALDDAKKNAKAELKSYIDNTSIKIEEGGKNYFLNEKNEDGLYKNSALNDIVKYIDERIDKETSSIGLNKIVQYGKEQIDIIRENIAAMLEYPKYVEGYTYGETSNECFEIKEQAIADMQNVHWTFKGENAIITDWAGTETSYLEIRQIAENDIKNARKAYREKIYTEYIENYISTYHSDIANEKWLQKIKADAKAELMYTEDVANITNIAAKYQEKIENGKKEVQKTPTPTTQPTTPEPTRPTNDEGYISTMTVKAGDKCEKRTAKDGTEVSAIGSFKGNWDIYIYESGKWTRKEDGDKTQLCWIDEDGTINTNGTKKGTARVYVTNQNGNGVDLSQGYYVIKVVEKEAPTPTPTPTTQPTAQPTKPEETEKNPVIQKLQKKGYKPMSDSVRTNCYYTGDDGYIYLDVGGTLFVQLKLLADEEITGDDVDEDAIYRFISCKPQQNAYDHEAVKRAESYMPGISRLPDINEMICLICYAFVPTENPNSGYIFPREIQLGRKASEWINDRYDNGAHCYVFNVAAFWKEEFTIDNMIIKHSWWGTHEYRILLDFSNV